MGVCVTVREFGNSQLFSVQNGAGVMGGGAEERKKARNMGIRCVAVLNRVFNVRPHREGNINVDRGEELCLGD